MHLLGCIVIVSTAIATSAVNRRTVETLADLPKEVVSDIITVFVEGTVHTLGNCNGYKNSAPKTEYWIYTRDNPQVPQIITDPIAIPAYRTSNIIFVVHGWLRRPNSTGTDAIKNAYLARNDSYVISVNWSAYSRQRYLSTYCAIAGVASNVADFMCKLKQNFNISLNTIHAVGHSMGAQLLGIVGQLVKNRCSETIKRITGLEPAGPLYTGVNLKDRLDPTDATFVDVMHSSIVGYPASCGHVDSYANGKNIQPGCAELVFDRDVLQNNTLLLLIAVDDITCNHERSMDFFAESVYPNKIVGIPCIRHILRCTPDTGSSDFIVLGEDCAGPGNAQNYVFHTRSSPPFLQNGTSLI